MAIKQSSDQSPVQSRSIEVLYYLEGNPPDKSSNSMAPYIVITMHIINYISYAVLDIPWLFVTTSLYFLNPFTF